MIRRRRVFYIEGYDPVGAAGYYALFGREWNRFLKVWPIRGNLGQLEIDSEDIAHWTVDLSGPDWQVATRYDFLRQEQIISANLAQPMPRQIARAFRWLADDLTSGALRRIFRASWRFGLFLVIFQSLLVCWIAGSVIVGALLGYAAAHFVGVPAASAFLIATIAAILVFAGLGALAERWFVVRINNCWPYLREFGRGEATCFDAAIEAGARHLVAAARADDAEEILVIGHSAGGVIGPALVARALELDPDLGRHGPRLVLLTLGSIMPAVTLHPRATRAREIIHHLATEPSLRWIDCQSRKDVMNFWDFDPVEGAGIEVRATRCNPLVRQVRFRDVLSTDFYLRARRNFFRVHYQFICAGDQRAPYDYFMIACGPLPAVHWATPSLDAVKAFAADASVGETAATSAAEG